MEARELLEIEMATLFEHDLDGRLALADRRGNPTPEFTIGRTDGAVVARLRNDLPTGLADSLTDLVAREPANAPLEAPLVFDRDYRRLLGSDGGGPEIYLAFVLSDIEPGKAGTKKGQPGAVPVSSGPNEIRREVVDVATVAGGVLGGFPHLVTDLEIGRPVFAIIRDRKAVSVAFSSRPGEHGAEAGVETLAEYRGRGYAGAVVAAWADSVRGSGRIAFYSAATENAASLAVGRRLGGAPYAALAHYRRGGG